MLNLKERKPNYELILAELFSGMTLLFMLAGAVTAALSFLTRLVLMHRHNLKAN